MHTFCAFIRLHRLLTGYQFDSPKNQRYARKYTDSELITDGDEIVGALYLV